jgi:hypothetical protein
VQLYPVPIHTNLIRALYTEGFTRTGGTMDGDLPTSLPSGMVLPPYRPVTPDLWDESGYIHIAS